MSVEAWLLACIVLAGAGFWGGVVFGAMLRSSDSRSQVPPYAVASSLAQDLEAYAKAGVFDYAAKPAPPAEYSVAGPLPRVPWNRRRKELEAKHRTKRKAMEEFR